MIITCAGAWPYTVKFVSSVHGDPWAMKKWPFTKRLSVVQAPSLVKGWYPNTCTAFLSRSHLELSVLAKLLAIPALSECADICRQVRSPPGPEHTVQGPIPVQAPAVSVHPSPIPRCHASVPVY